MKMTQEELDKILDKHAASDYHRNGSEINRADLRHLDLRGLDLNFRNLRGVDMEGADLRGCNVDYSTWPLWCGSRGVRIDNRLLCQLAAHIGCCKFKSIRVRRSDPDLRSFHKQCRRVGALSHRALELGLAKAGARHV